MNLDLFPDGQGYEIEQQYWPNSANRGTIQGCNDVNSISQKECTGHSYEGTQNGERESGTDYTGSNEVPNASRQVGEMPKGTCQGRAN